MAEADLERFLEKVRQLNAFVALSEADPDLRRTLRDCTHHREVVELARHWGFQIGRRWGEEEAQTGGDGTLLSGPPPPEGEERSLVLVETPRFRLERIHSCGACSPEGFWYDQPEEEWVCLLQGTARLRFEDEAMERELNRGDWLWIRAHRRHRLVATDRGTGSIWLALFWKAAGAG